MSRYLISFDEGAMTFPAEDLPAVADASHALVQEAMDAGVWVFGGGLLDSEQARVVAADGTVSEAPSSKKYIGGFAVLDLPSHDVAVEWAARQADACRCAQELREFMPDPMVGN
jgi:hypothetical protein